MHLHILGICGTFMGSLAQLAIAKGHRVTGSDSNVYPPMSTQLQAAGIELIEGFDAAQLELNPDVFVVGNVVSRGNPLMEAILNRGLPYISGPQWLAENILQGRWVLAVAGTHGKTTTASMLAWVLEYAGMAPGYLIGGVPGNFPSSARLGASDFFVIEADEYDTAFFDKRSKFVHYHPRTLIINNLEYDHADIFPDLAAIQTQFHHLLRVVPGHGHVLYPPVANVEAVLERGLWSSSHTLGSDWQSRKLSQNDAHFQVLFMGEMVGEVRWSLCGEHNIANAIAAVAAARHVGVDPQISCEALCQFEGVKRRMEFLGRVGNVSVYDDFAHHPTAIALTLAGLRNKVGADARIVALIEPRSNTMKQGVHKALLRDAIDAADDVMWYADANLDWDLTQYVDGVGVRGTRSSVCNSVDDMIAAVCRKEVEETGAEGTAPRQIHVVIMSNGGFQNIHQRLLSALREK